MPEKYKRNPNTTCLICHRAIYRRPSHIRRGRVFCSKTCNGKADRKEKPCVICAKPILASAHKKTCSRSCANKHRAGIKYRIGRPRDKVFTFRTIKTVLITKRGKKCERCQYNKREVLQIHHKDRDRENNSLRNLELLCPNCHAEEHILKSR